MQTSAQGVAALEHEEGVVLRAYRCPAGVWTIGAGLTSASGVVTVKAGMQISRAEATRLLQEALRRNYEPRVRKAMPGAKQHEFDAGVSFDFNTGAIHRASWVPLWVRKAGREAIWARFHIWNKGGGKVLPGLAKRRANEFAMMMDRVYPQVPRQPKPVVADVSRPADAVWALPLTAVERADATAAFYSLGYKYDLKLPGIPASVVRQFQRDHGLTVDGIIGRATLSTLQRRLNAKVQAVPATAAPVVATGSTATGTAADLTAFAHADAVLLGAAALYSLWVLWRYRDVVAAKVQRFTPRLAAFLRSF